MGLRLAMNVAAPTLAAGVAQVARRREVLTERGRRAAAAAAGAAWPQLPLRQGLSLLAQAVAETGDLGLRADGVGRALGEVETLLSGLQAVVQDARGRARAERGPVERRVDEALGALDLHGPRVRFERLDLRTCQNALAAAGLPALRLASGADEAARRALASASPPLLRLEPLGTAISARTAGRVARAAIRVRPLAALAMAVRISGDRGTAVLEFDAPPTAQALIQAINARMSGTGLRAFMSAGEGRSAVEVRSLEGGPDARLEIQASLAGGPWIAPARGEGGGSGLELLEQEAGAWASATRVPIVALPPAWAALRSILGGERPGLDKPPLAGEALAVALGEAQGRRRDLKSFVQALRLPGLEGLEQALDGRLEHGVQVPDAIAPALDLAQALRAPLLASTGPAIAPLGASQRERLRGLLLA